VEQWRREAAPAIAKQVLSDTTPDLPIGGVSTIYGGVVKAHYLLSLMRGGDRQKGVESGYPDRVEKAARRLLQRELEPIKRSREEEHEEPHVGAPVYVLIEADELEDQEHVSVLKLELKEGALEGEASLDGKEVTFG
jgi:hypothetical protein